MQPLSEDHRKISLQHSSAECHQLGRQLHRTGIRLVAWAILASASVMMPTKIVHAQAAHSPVVNKADIYHVIGPRNELSLTERFSRVLELESRITRVDGFDPGILTVSALTPNRIRIQAVAAGVTTLVLVDEFEKTYSIEVFVEGDVRHLQSYISRFFPDSSVSAVKVKDSVVLRGVVADPSHISQITEVAEQFFPKVINHMQFGAANQVRLQVRIMEAQRSRIRQLGFNWSLLGSNGYVSSNPGSLATPAGASLPPGGTPGLTYGGAGLADSSISFGLINGSNVFRGFLEALKQEGLLRILVETSVVADSGRPASLLSGGEFPILVPQALGTLSVEWREFGVRLEAVPIVLGQGQVILEIAPEFSERDFANAATLNNTTIPAITTRRANTQVRMKFGQTLMIGGLIATRFTAETDKLPLLGELPGIGAAFRRVRYDETETELIILVTPEYVAPLDPHQVPDGGPGRFSDVPTDRELFWQGMIEVPNYGGPVPPNSGMIEPMPYGMPGAMPEGMPAGQPMLIGPEGRPVPMPGQATEIQGQMPPSLTMPPAPAGETAPAPFGPIELNPVPEAAPQFEPEFEPQQAPPAPPAALPDVSPDQPGQDSSSIPLLPIMPVNPTVEQPDRSASLREISQWQESSGRPSATNQAVRPVQTAQWRTPAHKTTGAVMQDQWSPVSGTQQPALIRPSTSQTTGTIQPAAEISAPQP